MTRVEDAAELVPPEFRASVQRFSADDGAVGGPSGADWSAQLPRRLAEVLDDWGLEPLGIGHTGWTAVVVPVRRDGQPLALKLVWPHVEARDEALVLRHWDGRGAVRLVAADPSRGALLLEQLDPSRDLRTLDVDQACEVVGGLLRQLHVPAPPGLRPLSTFAREQLSRLESTEGALPRRMLARTAGLVHELTADESCDATLVHTDLHYENVLASLPGSGRPEWLAIDPHAMAGHPGFEVQPLLRNRTDELGTGSTLRYLVRRRLEICCEAAAVDEDEALAWTYVHTAMQAGWAARDGDRDALSFNIALLKALDG
ncbi:streptomycin 6-kinase [Pedococcus dokdonensis]|uniref:Streptomycin 6-kinase n=1 Tax=Pedococcus dokdonensis TaxID=443156 RepID=A0A1H0M4Z4_9MICO|nr:aminoglycoside phosphotransferase family protein [Pedococcus dokdonensis]SDO75454.1 streptomycin 6-kinase [Pedococcus dokdonensis]